MEITREESYVKSVDTILRSKTQHPTLTTTDTLAVPQYVEFRQYMGIAYVELTEREKYFVDAYMLTTIRKLTRRAIQK